MAAVGLRILVRPVANYGEHANRLRTVQSCVDLLNRVTEGLVSVPAVHLPGFQPPLAQSSTLKYLGLCGMRGIFSQFWLPTATRKNTQKNKIMEVKSVIMRPRVGMGYACIS